MLEDLNIKIGEFPFENLEVLETDFFRVGQDWEIPIEGFLIISPKRNIRTLADFNDSEIYQYGFLLREIRRGMEDVLEIDDVYQFQNDDSSNGFHLWMFPRYEWMDKFGRKIESVRPIMEYAKKNMYDYENVQRVKLTAVRLKNYWN